MMTYSRFIFFLLAASMSCSPPGGDEKPVAVKFVMKEFKVESQAGCSTDSIPCAYYQVSYPEFAGLDSAVSADLQRQIDGMVSMGNPEADGRPMKEIGDSFIQSFLEVKNEMPEFITQWYYSAHIDVEVLTDTLLSLTVQEEYYSGGAHGGHGTYFINLVPQTGAPFTLDKLLKPGYEAALQQAGEKIFRQVHEIPESASLEVNGFQFPDDTFRLNQNYGFNKAGIVFFYNSYEISSYAAGPTEVLIPYQMLSDWLR